MKSFREAAKKAGISISPVSARQIANKTGLQPPVSLKVLIEELEDWGEIAFSLEQPLSQLSKENDAKPLVCNRATVTCRSDGTWGFVADLRNEEAGADVSFILAVQLNYVDSAGVQFGATMEGDLSAAGDGPITKIGLRTRGVPPAGIFRRQGKFEAFRDSSYWDNVHIAKAQFDMIAAFNDYKPPPDDGD